MSEHSDSPQLSDELTEAGLRLAGLDGYTAAYEATHEALAQVSALLNDMPALSDVARSHLLEAEATLRGAVRDLLSAREAGQ